MSKCVNCGSEILTGDIHWEMGLCNNCYNELYKDHKTHISLDKMWLNIAQRFRDENEKLQDKVADLEAKLAEKEKENATLEAMLVENANDRKTMQEFKIGEDEYDLTDEDARNSLCWEVEELKQQLAEKEQEIESLRENSLSKRIFKEKLIPSHCMEQYEKYEQQIDKLTKDKISFAVEQLEKVKGLIANHTQELWTCEDDDIDVVLYEEIDNQIKELKGGK